MIFSSIEIGGKLRPVRFNYAALYEYERNTGRNAISDFTRMESGELSVVLATDLIFAGLSLGCKTVGKEVDFSVHDVADWVFSDPVVVEKTMEIFSESFPKTGPAPEDGDTPKKAKPRHGTS